MPARLRVSSSVMLPMTVRLIIRYCEKGDRMAKRPTILSILILLLLNACISEELVDPTPIFHKTSTVTPGYQETKELPTQTQLIPTVTKQPVTAELVLTRTPEVEGLVPEYKSESWTIYLVSVEGIVLPYAPGHEGFGIREIEEDGDGVLWMGTKHGLVRFDGQNWELLASETEVTGANHVVLGDDGSIWFSLNDGVFRYINGNVYLMYKLADGEYLDWLNKNPDGDIWISTRLSSERAGSFQFYDGEKWESLKFEEELPFEIISNLIFDSAGRLYIWGLFSSNIDSGLAYYEDGEWVVFDSRDQYPSPERIGFYDHYVPLVIDEQDHSWFFMDGEGLFEFYDDKIHLRALPVKENVHPYGPNDMVIDNNGVFWLGAFSSPGAFLTKYVPGTDYIQSIDGSDEFYYRSSDDEWWPPPRYVEDNIIPFSNVYTLFADSRNRLWIDTYSGIFVFDLNQ